MPERTTTTTTEEKEEEEECQNQLLTRYLSLCGRLRTLSCTFFYCFFTTTLLFWGFRYFMLPPPPSLKTKEPPSSSPRHNNKKSLPIILRVFILFQKPLNHADPQPSPFQFSSVQFSSIQFEFESSSLTHTKTSFTNWIDWVIDWPWPDLLLSLLYLFPASLGFRVVLLLSSVECRVLYIQLPSFKERHHWGSCVHWTWAFPYYLPYLPAFNPSYIHLGIIYLSRSFLLLSPSLQGPRSRRRSFCGSDNSWSTPPRLPHKPLLISISPSRSAQRRIFLSISRLSYPPNWRPLFFYPTLRLATSDSPTFSMTMVIQNQNRQYGGMGFDNVYQNNIPQNSPQFTDPWNAQSSPNQPPPMYPTAMGSNQMNMAQVKQEDVSRPPTAISMPYSNIPVSAPSMVAGANNANNNAYSNPAGYGGLDMTSMPQDIPRTTFEQGQNYSAASTMGAFTPTNFAPLNYAQQMQQQQQQHHHHHHPNAQQQMQPDGRRMSQVWVPRFFNLQVETVVDAT